MRLSFRKDPSPSTRSRAPQGAARCGRCQAVARPNTPRCARCGNRLGAAPVVVSSTRMAIPAPVSSAAPPELSPIEREILRAAQYGKIGDHTIYVVGSDVVGEGEVKSGGRRFYGNQAVAAVAALIVPGLVVNAGEDRFELTEAGTRLAVRYEMGSRFGEPA